MQINAQANRPIQVRSVGKPLQPRYRPTFEDTINVANQERLHRTPRNMPLQQQIAREPLLIKAQKRNTTPKTMVLNTKESVASPRYLPQPTHGNYLSARNLNPKSTLSSYSPRSNVDTLISPKHGPRDNDLDDEYVLKTVQELVLQDNGKYRVKNSANCLINSKSDILRKGVITEHPFAPSDSRQVFTSDEMTKYRNRKNFSQRSDSSGYSSLSSTGTRSMTKKSPTGLMLNRVVKILEATPPHFLVVPENKLSRVSSPSQTRLTSVGTNTIIAPPNSGDVAKPHHLKPYNSSPNLLENRKTVQEVSSMSTTPSKTRPTQHWLEPPSAVKPSRFSGGFHSRCNETTPSPDASASSSTAELTTSPDRPPHLSPSPYKSYRRSRSTGSLLSVPNSNRSGRSSALSNVSSLSKSNIKVNSLGLVYI